VAVTATELEYGGDEDLAVAGLRHDSVEANAWLDDVLNRFGEPWRARDERRPSRNLRPVYQGCLAGPWCGSVVLEGGSNRPGARSLHGDLPQCVVAIAVGLRLQIAGQFQYERCYRLGAA
jgi:hypothetical protein